MERLKKPEPTSAAPRPCAWMSSIPRATGPSKTIACDPGAKAFGVMDGGRLVYIYEDAEGELTLKCVKY